MQPLKQFTQGAWSDLTTENAHRSIPVPAEVVAELKARKEKLDGNVVRIHQGADERVIFPGEDGGPLDYSNWRNRSWLQMLGRTGPCEEHPKREPVVGTLHMLSHTCCTLALSQGALPKDMDDAAEKIAGALLRPVVAKR